MVQVLTKAVKPPTPDAAKLAAVVSQQQLAMQHVRLQLARMVKQAHPAQVGRHSTLLYSLDVASLLMHTHGERESEERGGVGERHFLLLAFDNGHGRSGTNSCRPALVV